MPEIAPKIADSIPNYVRYISFSIFVMVNFFDAMEYSIQAPFYPAEAEKKNATSIEYGIVIGMFELVVFLACPLVPTLLEKIGFYATYHVGLCLVGVSIILFGFLDRVNDRTLFIGFSIILRIIPAIGTSMCAVSSYTVVVKYFPGSVATVFAITETAFALGNAVGPAIGGVLFQLGGTSFGFTLPFLVLGLCISSIILPSSIVFLREKNSRPESKSKGFGFFTLFKIPVIILYAISVIVAAIGVGFLLTTLEPHIRQFNLNPVQVGLVFLSYAGTYALTAALWGMICDKVRNPEYALLISLILMTFGYLWIGPVSFIPYDTSLWLVNIGLACFGLGQAGAFVSSFMLMMKGGKKYGYKEDELAPYVSSLWISSLCLGSFIGPSVAGVLYKYFGFRLATVFVVGLFKILILVSIITLIFPKLLDRSRNLEPEEEISTGERSPLLPKNEP